MPPNPILIPSPVASKIQPPVQQRISPYITSLTLASLILIIAAKLPWAQRWLISGSAIESLLLLYGDLSGPRIFPRVPLWTVLASLNLIYAISSTSWLLYDLFAVLCYPFIFFTCLFQFSAVANLVRKWLRRVLVGLHFTRDTIAFFDLPALEIDTDVSGLFVVRGVSVFLSSLRIVAHGVELGTLENQTIRTLTPRLTQR